MDDSLLARLRAAVGSDHVVTDPTLLAAAAADWTGRFHGRAAALVRPGDAEQVAAVLAACTDAGVPVTPRGGNTGLVGGAVPVDGGVLLLTERLDRLEDVDAISATVLVGAGVALARVQQHVADAGWAVGVDLASRDTATVGGMVATDAGGARVVLHGPMRAHVAGLEVALADGTVTTPRDGTLAKDTAGYDLGALLVGSEGTLGVVTAVRLRLVRPVRPSATLLLGVGAADDVATTVAEVRDVVAGTGVLLTACEVVAAAGLRLVAAALGVRPPLDTPFALLVELAGPVDDDLVAALAGLAARGRDGEPAAVVALDVADRRRLWDLRERHTEAINRLGVPVKLDVAVPAGRLGELLERAPAAAGSATPDARTFLFGHAAEANCHVNVVLPADADARVADAVEDAVLALVAELGGTVSAEHGIGRAKVRHLPLTRDPGSIAAMRAVKRALDPAGVLNPGVVLPAEDRDRP